MSQVLGMRTAMEASGLKGALPTPLLRSTMFSPTCSVALVIAEIIFLRVCWPFIPLFRLLKYTGQRPWLSAHHLCCVPRARVKARCRGHAQEAFDENAHRRLNERRVGFQNFELSSNARIPRLLRPTRGDPKRRGKWGRFGSR